MNRMGMLVDLSHVSPKVMSDVLDIAQAPVMFSHSSAYSVCPHPRNVPDDILLRVVSVAKINMSDFLFLRCYRFIWVSQYSMPTYM